MSLGNKELVQMINNEFAGGSNDINMNFIADDIKWKIIGMPVITGKKNFVEMMQMLDLENFPVITVKNIIAEGDYVVVESSGQAVTKTGRPYNPSYCDIYFIKNGKIQELTTYVVDCGEQ